VRRALPAVLLFVLAAASPAAAALYRWVDAEGVIHYTSDLETIPEAYRNAARKIDTPTPRTPEPSALPRQGVTAPPPAAAPAPGTVPPPAAPPTTLPTTPAPPGGVPPAGVPPSSGALPPPGVVPPAPGTVPGPSAVLPPPSETVPLSPATVPPSGSVQMPSGGPVIVQAHLNGVPLRLLVDTGADRTVIAPEMLARAGIDVRRGTPGRITGVTGSADAPLVAVQRLDVAGAQIGPLAVVAHAVPGDGIDGLLGRDVLDAFTVTFDAAGNRATLTPR
jgi:hypothetical protein